MRIELQQGQIRQWEEEMNLAEKNEEREMRERRSAPTVRETSADESDSSGANERSQGKRRGPMMMDEPMSSGEEDMKELE